MRVLEQNHRKQGICVDLYSINIEKSTIVVIDEDAFFNGNTIGEKKFIPKNILEILPTPDVKLMRY